MASRFRRALSRKQDKQFNWYPALDSVCGAVRLPPRYCGTIEGGEGPDSEGPVLVDCVTGEPGDTHASPAALHLIVPREAAAANATDAPDTAYEADEVTVVRTVGSIVMEPYFVADADLIATLATLDAGPASAVVNNAILNTPYFVRAGLKKDGWLFDAATAEYTPPVRDPLETEEWVDGRFIRTWQRARYASQKAALAAAFVTPNAVAGFCSNVSAAAAGAPANTLSSGSGTINIPAISTDCQFVAEENSAGIITSAFAGTIGRPEGVIRFNLNSRRRLRFRESEGLTFFVNWTSINKAVGLLDPAENCAPAVAAGRMAVGFDVYAYVKMLVETN